MNLYQQEMFDALEVLVASGDAFYRQEFLLDGARYWIYNYRLSSYSDFERPFGRECRGHMFEVNADGKAVRLASLPMQKFHNLNECPLTMGLDLSQVDTVEAKADGSLMSSYMHEGRVRLKSKGSLFSEQAIDAMKWLDKHEEFEATLHDFAVSGETVNLEWCAPHNRIVIGYPSAHLMVLNARNNETGEYADREWLEDEFGFGNVIARVDTNGLNTVTFVQSIPAMQDDIEGYVARIGDLWFKIKTEKYMSLHHAKDSINNPRRLFEAIVDEGIDDLRSMFAHDVVAIQTIDAMQGVVIKLYNGMVATVEGFYNDNKTLDRKDFAIKGRDKEQLDQRFFGLVMNKYLGKDVDYKTFLKAKYKEFGIKDTQLEAE